jgi:putative transposase
MMRALHHCVFDINAHLVLVTKYRKKAIDSAMLRRLEEILAATCTKWDCRLAEFNGERDHVHLLLELHPAVQPSKLVNNLKTVSSRLIRKEFPANVRHHYGSNAVFWSRSYCFVSCGGAPLALLRQYIEQQAGAN